MKLVITGGGTGGHTVPAVTIYDAFVERFNSQSDEQFECLYIGSHHGIEKEVAQQKEINYHAISTGKLRRYFSFENFTDILKILKGICDAFWKIRSFKPTVVFSTGGFVSVPVVIASKLLGVPILIHEQTSSIGLANKISGYFAQKIAITFPSSKKHFPADKVVHTGQPIRKELFSGTRENCFNTFDLDTNRPLIYITGGSQGSHKINQAFKEILPDLLTQSNVIHQCGKTQGHNDFEDLTQFRSQLSDDLQKRYVIKDFIREELKDILNGCDLLIGRSGAGTVNESMALKVPSIFIPLAIATKNEQLQNAQLIASFGGAHIIEEKELTAKLSKEKILSLILNQSDLNQMKKSFDGLSSQNAVEHILELVIALQKK